MNVEKERNTLEETSKYDSRWRKVGKKPFFHGWKWARFVTTILFYVQKAKKSRFKLLGVYPPTIQSGQMLFFSF